MEAFVDAENLREIRDDENFIDDDNFNPADYQGREIERIIRLDARIHTMAKRHQEDPNPPVEWGFPYPKRITNINNAMA